jgi:hypothetical protein
MALVFPRDGHGTDMPVSGGRFAPALFDKWFEERETQAAESWRIQWVHRALGGSKRLWRSLRFSHHHGASGPGQPGRDALYV